MTSSEIQPPLTITPEILTNCVYLIPGAGEGGRFKLGITSRLPARVASLRLSDGPLDLDGAVIVAAKDRRAAFDLEGVLQATFDAPAWRAGSARVSAYNGSSEWYAAAALEPMVALVGEMITRDERCGVPRFALGHRLPWLAAWCAQARVVRRKRRWTEDELRTENARFLARAEANFARLQAWMAARRERLVEVRPVAGGGESLVGRTFVFEGEEGTAMGADGEELVALCLVSHRHAQGVVTFGYFGSVGPDTVRAGAYAVEFLVTGAFEQARGFSLGLDALLARIADWICRESF